MATPMWLVRIAGSSSLLAGDVVVAAGPTLEFDPGPDEIRLDWGTDALLNGDPRFATYTPDAAGDFERPSELYPAGSFEIAATGVFGSDELTLRIAVTTFPQETGALVLSGGTVPDFFAGGLGGDRFSGLGGDDFLLGLDGSDAMNGGAGADWMDGGAGNDTLLGGTGDDVLFGGAGDDVLRAGAGTGSDALFGQAGADRLEAGPDGVQLDGGDGRDTLVGGAGRDRFMYVAPPDGIRDAILGFTPGEDSLVLTFLRESGVTMTPDRLLTAAAGMTDTGPYAIYVPASGRLLVDLNGTDTGGRIEVAMLVGAPVIGFDDFIF